MLLMREMELRDLLTFVAVAEAGSVRHAMERLHLSQPTITRRIQNLERSVGLTLFDHRRRPATLTPAGQAFLQRSRRLTVALAELQGLEPPAGEAEAECRLGMPASIADLVFPGLAVRLAEEFPHLRVNFSILWSHALIHELQSRTLDAAIVYAPDVKTPPAPLRGECLLHVPVTIVESRQHRRPRAALQPSQLNAQWWVLNPEGCCFRTILGKMLQVHRASMHTVLEVSGFRRQLSIVAQGHGLGFVPEPVLRRSPLSSRLRAVHLSGAAPRVPVWMMEGAARSVVEPAIRWTVSDVRRRLRESHAASALPAKAPANR
jgi:DNA-binding transcriptional LysR family regulator